MARALLCLLVSLTALILLFACKSPILQKLDGDLSSALLSSATSGYHSCVMSLFFMSMVLPVVSYFACKYLRFLRTLSCWVWIGLLIILYLSMALRGLQFPLCIDDAYIDFRYVRNFLDGYGLAFQTVKLPHSINPLGISSPLHLLILAGLSGLYTGLDIAAVSRGCNYLLDLVNILLLFFFVRATTGSVRPALIAITCYGLSDYTIGEVVRGKEGPLMTFLMLCYITAAAFARTSLRACFAGLLALTRPEGILLVFVDVFRHVRSGGNLRSYILPGALGAVFALVLLAFFGGVIPSGMIAKWIIYDRMNFIGFSQLAEFLTRYLFGARFFVLADDFAYLLSFSLYFLVLSMCARLLYSRVELKNYVILLYLLGLFFGGLNAITFPFPWYYAWWSLLPALTWAQFALGFARLKKSTLMPFVCVVLAAVNLWGMTEPGEYAYRLGKSIELPIFRLDTMQGRLANYEAAAKYVNAHSTPGELVACSELGVLGMTLSTDLRILDLHGIISPDMLELYRSRTDRLLRRNLITFPGNFAAVLKPDWVIVYDIFVKDTLFRDSYFDANYTLCKIYPYDFYDSRGLFVFKKKSVSNRE